MNFRNISDADLTWLCYEAVVIEVRQDVIDYDVEIRKNNRKSELVTR